MLSHDHRAGQIGLCLDDAPAGQFCAHRRFHLRAETRILRDAQQRGARAGNAHARRTERMGKRRRAVGSLDQPEAVRLVQSVVKRQAALDRLNTASRMPISFGITLRDSAVESSKGGISRI